MSNTNKTITRLRLVIAANIRRVRDLRALGHFHDERFYIEEFLHLLRTDKHARQNLCWAFLQDALRYHVKMRKIEAGADPESLGIYC